MHTSNLKYDALICDYNYLMSKVGRVKLGHVFREQNKVTDELAKEEARRSRYDATIIFVIPPVFAIKQL